MNSINEQFGWVYSTSRPQQNPWWDVGTVCQQQKKDAAKLGNTIPAEFHISQAKPSTRRQTECSKLHCSVAGITYFSFLK